MTTREFEKHKVRLIAECTALERLTKNGAVRCEISGKRVSLEELFMFSLFGLEYVRGEV